MTKKAVFDYDQLGLFHIQEHGVKQPRLSTREACTFHVSRFLREPSTAGGALDGRSVPIRLVAILGNSSEPITVAATAGLEARGVPRSLNAVYPSLSPSLKSHLCPCILIFFRYVSSCEVSTAFEVFQALS